MNCREHLTNFIRRKIKLFEEISLYKSQESCHIESSMCQLCSTHHDQDFPVTLHTPGVYGPWAVSNHKGGNWSEVLGTRCGIWRPWYCHFKVGWFKPPQVLLDIAIYLVDQVLIINFQYVQTLHTWFDCYYWTTVLIFEQCLYIKVDLRFLFTMLSFLYEMQYRSWPQMDHFLGFRACKYDSMLEYNVS